MDADPLVRRGAVVAIPHPAAGAGFTYSAPGSQRTRIVTVAFQLVTSATVATRTVVVSYKDSDGTVFYSVPAPFTQAASKTTEYSFALGIVNYGVNDGANIGGPLPDVTLDVGESLVVTVTNVDTTDAVTNVRLYAEQYPTSADTVEYRQAVAQPTLEAV
jgi:hypothetical protein